MSGEQILFEGLELDVNSESTVTHNQTGHHNILPDYWVPSGLSLAGPWFVFQQDSEPKEKLPLSVLFILSQMRKHRLSVDVTPNFPFLVSSSICPSGYVHQVDLRWPSCHHGNHRRGEKLIISGSFFWNLAAENQTLLKVWANQATFVSTTAYQVPCGWLNRPVCCSFVYLSTVCCETSRQQHRGINKLRSIHSRLLALSVSVVSSWPL